MEVYIALKKHEIQKPFFMKMVAKAKKEAPAASKAEAKQKALKAEKAVFKGRDIALPTKVCLVKAMVFSMSCMDVTVGL